MDRERWEAEVWQHFPDSEPRFRAAVMEGSGIGIRFDDPFLPWIGLRPAGGSPSQAKALELFDRWRADPGRFEAAHSAAMVEAVREFARAHGMEPAAGPADPASSPALLPTPPSGYAWFRVEGGLRILSETWFRLYSAESYGPPPG